MRSSFPCRPCWQSLRGKIFNTYTVVFSNAPLGIVDISVGRCFWRNTMRIFYPNLNRPKKTAKTLSKKLSISLSQAQVATAKVCGFIDWHDFEKNYKSELATPLDQNINDTDFIKRHAHQSLCLANILGIPDGDAQYFLATARLTGDRPVLLSDQIAIRLECLRQTVLPLKMEEMRGTTGWLEEYGASEAVILKKYGYATDFITHRGNSNNICADYEISFKNPPLLFLPMASYMPYGYWEEDDGAKVLFSRDYKPLWRIRKNQKPERVEPWLWISWQRQEFLFGDHNTPWNFPIIKQEVESFLRDCGVQTLPILADAFPFIVLDDEIASFSNAVEPLRQRREEIFSAS